MNTSSVEYLIKNRGNNFNLIRLVAAVAVIYGHTFAITGHGPIDIFLQYVGFKFIGGVAVDVFFIISGFFITSSFLNSKNIKYFCISRVLRIYPALIVCIFLTVFILGPIFTNDNNYFTNVGTWRYLMVNASGIDTLYDLPGVFDKLVIKGVNGSLWSIAVEIKSYIIILLLGIITILIRKELFNFLFFLLCIISYFEPSIFESIFKYENHRHVVFMFIIGSFIYINKDKFILNPYILLFLLFFAATQHGTENFKFAYMILLPYVVFYIAFLPEFKLFNKLGDYSYGCYLYGWIIQQIVFSINPLISNYEHVIYSVLLSVLMGILSWHLIEKHTLKLKKRFA